MPEYLSPGVYVEEVPSKSTIEGVSTTVTGFVGPTRFGPITGRPELLTSYLDFSRIYCGVDQLNFADTGAQDNYMAHAVKAFFDNGGSMLYVARAYEPSNQGVPASDIATCTISSLPGVTLVARFPGAAGNMQVTFLVKTTPNLLVASTTGPAARGVNANDLVFIKPGTSVAVSSGLYDVGTDSSGNLTFTQGLQTVPLASLDPTTMRVHRVTLSVITLRAGMFETPDAYTDLQPNPNARNAVTSTFTAQPNSRALQLSVPFAIETPTASFMGSDLVTWLFGTTFINTTLSLSLATSKELLSGSIPQLPVPTASLQVVYMLSGGGDGNLPGLTQYQGQPASRDTNTNVYTPSSGLESFADIDEISIVAAPGFSYGYSENPQLQPDIEGIAQALIEHCEIRMKYRIAILDSPDNFLVSDIQTFRGKFDSSYAALYYPWLKIVDPLDPDNIREIIVAPSGYVCGICARSDDANGVSKAPANEIPLGAIDLELQLNKSQQDVLNPIGVNCWRYLPPRGIRLWGARTLSSDPDWKYVNVRRYFAYVEHSLDKGTQWVVFEKNDYVTWANVTQTVYDFLYNEWKNDALLGAKPEQAFFVRCDQSTMTANDRANGRLVCLIGISVIEPAEFVIFRIGQYTADTTT